MHISTTAGLFSQFHKIQMGGCTKYSHYGLDEDDSCSPDSILVLHLWTKSPWSGVHQNMSLCIRYLGYVYAESSSQKMKMVIKG